MAISSCSESEFSQAFFAIAGVYPVWRVSCTRAGHRGADRGRRRRSRSREKRKKHRAMSRFDRASQRDLGVKASDGVKI
jgi:hypothetical protein